MGEVGEVSAGESGAGALPEGTVTFLFTDLEGSTALLQAHPAAYRAAVARHHDLLRGAVEASGGVVFETVGDAVYAAFAQPTDAVAAALAGQLALQAEEWGEVGELRARMGLHLGEAERQGGHYFGAPLYRCARLTATAHGGQVVLSQAACDLVQDSLPPGVSLRDLGAHRLKDLQRPERVFQLRHPALLAEFPPLRSLDVLPHNLPLQVTSFVGRERELAAVAALLGGEPSGPRLVTLTGPGGTGKTRLALQAAADALEAHPDGVWLAELGALADPALVPQVVAAAAGVREEPGRPLPATLADALRAKRVLLVLDNCEHLLDACARLTDGLVRACPHLRLLCTSREALGIAGEAVWRVPSLPVPEDGAGQPPPAAVDVARCAAVRLFVDRAAAVQPTFALTERNAPAVAQICARLDGIPLALELAAARVRVLPPGQLLARLEDRFRLLTGGSRTALERHQTLQAAVDWSYALLSEPEQTLFARLAAFAGGWTLEAAEAVCAGPDGADGVDGAGLEAAAVLDLLTRLVDQSLVEVHEQADGTARYRLLETLRQYARLKLAAAGAADTVRRAHAGYYLAQLAEADLSSPGQAEWLGRLERDHDNLRAALDWWEEHPEAGDPQLLLRAVARWEHWNFNGHVGEGAQRLARALAAPGAAAPTPARSAALYTATALAMFGGDYRTARALAEERIALERVLGREDHTGAWALAGIEFASGDVAAARRRLEAGLREFPAARASGHWLTLLGRTLLQDEPAAGRAYFEEVLIRYRAAARGRPTTSLAHALDWAAAGDFEGGDHARARARWLEALRMRQELGDKAEIGDSLEGLAALAAAAGRQRRALRLAGAAAAARRRAGRRQRLPDRERLERWLTPARRALLLEEATTAWAEGEAMPLEQAVAYALEDAADAA
jgi:predicted ATPase/class 3 adenylate cyclase